ncbi:MAG: DUF58 domain-containing protein [Holosporales bacterium]|jgi:uncharacterized protein (DUF58 family)
MPSASLSLAAHLMALPLPRLALPRANVHAPEALRQRAGSGAEPWQLRPYHPGDPVRRIAWRASARTDTPLLLERRDEAAPQLDILIDTTAPDADFAEKSTTLLALGAALAWRLSHAGFKIRFAGLNQAPGRTISHCLAQAEATVPLEQGACGANPMRPLVLLTPLLQPLPRLAAMASPWILLAASLAETEKNLPGQGSVRLHGGGAKVTVPDVVSAQHTYKQRLEAHENALRQVFPRLLIIETDKPEVGLSALWQQCHVVR